MLDLRRISDETLSAKLLELVSKERSLLCMIIICVMEIARRKSYLSTHSDLFSYLTDLLTYSHGSAQRRKDAALLALEIPSILEDVKSGSLNLSQITLAQCAFRLSERLKKKALKDSAKKVGIESDDSVLKAELQGGISKESKYEVPIELKKEILTAIKDKSVAESEVIIYSMLNIKPKSRTKLTRQSDGSVRCETTHSKLQWEKIERTKELLSHSVPTGEMTDLMEYLCDRVIAFKDKTVPKQGRKRASSKANMSKANGSTVLNDYDKDHHKSATPTKSEIPSDILMNAKVGRSENNKSDAPKKACDNIIASFEGKDQTRECVTSSVLNNLKNVAANQIPDGIELCPSPTRFVKPRSRSAIPAAVQRHIFSRDKGCQHVTPNGKPCGSRWQLQIDHIQPVWAGGSDEAENLRVLCGSHNRAAYRQQSGVMVC